MLRTNYRLSAFSLVMLCFSIVLFNGCMTLTEIFEQPSVEQNKFEAKDTLKKDIPPAKSNNPATKENKTINPPPTKQGSGYLSEGSALSMGVMDGDEELKVLKKIKRLEARLETEKNKVETLNKELSTQQTAKEGAEKDFADTKKKLEEKNTELLDVIKSLESKLKESEARVTTAEQELASAKKELLKSQIIETKVQQELYKLKIDNLKQDKE